MFNHIKVIPVIALALATLAPATASAKVPFQADAERGPQAAVETTMVKAASMQRYRKSGAAAKSERLATCAHSHRYSKQHRM